MNRLALYLGGISAAMAAMVLFHDKQRAARRVPATKAAAMLKAAWKGEPLKV